MQDEESGKICYAKNLVRDYRGFFTRKSYADKEHPQDFVKGLNDPKPCHIAIQFINQAIFVIILLFLLVILVLQQEEMDQPIICLKQMV